MACDPFQDTFLNKQRIQKEPNQNKNLLNASKEGNLEGVKEAIAKEADVNAVDGSGYSALMLATTKEIAEFLINQEASLEFKNDQGETALIVQAGANESEIVSLLLEKESDPRQTNHYGQNALMKAASSKGSSIDTVLALIDVTDDLNATDSNGDTALLLAILKNNSGKALALIKARARTDIKNKAGWTAEIAAEHFNFTELLEAMESQKRESPCKLIFG